METLWQDVRYGARLLAKNPGFTAVAVLTFALGIGANTAVFSVINTLLFRPLPVEEPGQLVALSAQQQQSPFAHGLSYPDFRDFRALTEVFADATAYTASTGQLSAAGTAPDRMLLLLTTGNYFSLLGVRAALGRTYLPEESERMGAGNVIILSHDYWQRQFGSNPSVVGQAVRLNARPFTIVGVLPKKFSGTFWPLAPDGYIPVSALELISPKSEAMLENRSVYSFRVIARLRPGVSLAEARTGVEVQTRRLELSYPETNSGVRVMAFPEPMSRLEPGAALFVPPIAATFMGLVSLVLLIACANVANLLLARATGRQKEMAIRAALGASRWRIVRQLVVESLLLALLGGAAGLLLAQWATRAMASIRLASDIPLVFSFALDYRAFAFALLAAVVTGMATGLAPAWQATKTNLNETLKEGGRSGAGGAARQRLRSVLVVAQVGVSLVLLICAALFVQSMRNAAGMDLGFRTENRLLLSLDTELQRYDEGRGRLFFRDLLDRVRALPGVRSATLTWMLPISVNNADTKVFAEGQVVTKDSAPLVVFYTVVDTDYFTTLGTPIVQGRGIVPDDKEDSRGAVVVNEYLAERLWPGQNPLGKRLSLESASGPFLEVVGVARNGIYNLPGEAPRGYLYVPFSQNYRAERVLIAHTAGDPLEQLPAIRSQVAALDPELPLFDVRTMETHIRQGKGALVFKLASGLVGGFGLVGMLLAAIGLYGVVAYSVSQRTHEIGVRMALGASPSKILRMVVRQGMTLTLVGIGLGWLGALALTRLVANLLVDISPTDPSTFAGVALLLAGVALLSAYFPARRAASVEPMTALRYE